MGFWSRFCEFYLGLIRICVYAVNVLGSGKLGFVRIERALMSKHQADVLVDMIYMMLRDRGRKR